MTNKVKVKQFGKNTRKKLMEIVKNNCSKEQMLEDYKTTVMVGQIFEIFDEYNSMCVDLAAQLDELNEVVRDSYDMIKEVKRIVEKP